MANKILIIDDEPETLEVLETKFKAAGFEVALCDNGRDALAAAKAAKPQAVVMKILYVITSTTLGGAEKALFEVVTRLDRKRFTPCAVISLKPEGVYAQKLRGHVRLARNSRRRAG